MSQKVFFTVSGTMFGIITLLHALRLLLGWPAYIGTFEVPMWCSWVSVALAGSLAFSAFRLQRRR